MKHNQHLYRADGGAGKAPAGALSALYAGPSLRALSEVIRPDIIERGGSDLLKASDLRAISQPADRSTVYACSCSLNLTLRPADGQETTLAAARSLQNLWRQAASLSDIKLTVEAGNRYYTATASWEGTIERVEREELASGLKPIDYLTSLSGISRCRKAINYLKALLVLARWVEENPDTYTTDPQYAAGGRLVYEPVDATSRLWYHIPYIEGKAEEEREAAELATRRYEAEQATLREQEAADLEKQRLQTDEEKAARRERLLQLVLPAAVVCLTLAAVIAVVIARRKR